MSQDRYLIPAATHRVEEEIKRSRFITTLAHTPTLDAARTLIAGVRAEFPDATHNCWAYVVGPPGNTSQIGLSDDGEPHGSAGRPMLTVLLHAGVGDIAAVVTRYFGGTLLGVGGLVRAYSGGVQLGLATLPTIERVPAVLLDVVIDYTAITPFQRLTPNFEAVIVEQEFGLDATYRVRVPRDRVDAFGAAIAELTNGQALVEIASSE